MGDDEKRENAVASPIAHAKPSSPEATDLDHLFRAHHEMVFRTAVRITGSAVDAEDVLQTVFLRLARREDLDLAPSPAGYLHRAAVNAALDTVRGRTRLRAVALDDAHSTLPDLTTDGPDAEHDERELKEFLRLSLAGLSPKAAEMFALRYFEGYDNREIAEMTGSSHMVVAVLLHRARGRVRKEIFEFLGKNQ